MPIFFLVIFGLFVHLVFLFCIFDVYFKSPIVKGISEVHNSITPPGQRVVLVSVDGLRADALNTKDPLTSKFVAEYLQNIIHYRGTWGVSHSRVPTESRPGHVAMLAGFYEDPSAITKGWKENPVDFDSVFNRSHCSFSWGSPDIINIFHKGLQHPCAFAESYEDEQNFAGDTRKYDDWVYEKVDKFLKQTAGYFPVIYEKGIFFFLHLLGQDTSGHTNKPHSVKYMENLKNVDSILKKLEELFCDLYKDNKTTFIVTSDHGMTNWGSHGAGESDETETPIVAWGAGIKKPTFPIKQNNISQADVVPLLSILLGAAIPVNSLGILPTDFLNMSARQIAEGTKLNAKQMVAQLLKSMKDQEAHTISWLYKPFPKLSLKDINFMILTINKAIESQKYSEAIEQSKFLIKMCHEGLNYYHNYYQKSLLITISLSYFGWIIYLLLVLMEEHHAQEKCKNSSKALKMILALAVFLTFIIITIQKLPWSFYLYLLLPQILWYVVLNKSFPLPLSLNIMNKNRFLLIFLCIGSAVESLVLSFFKRWILCISMVIVIGWGLCAFRPTSIRYSLARTFWLASGASLGVFPLLPTIGSVPSPSMTVASGLALWILLAAGARAGLIRSRGGLFRLPFNFFFLLLAVWNNYSVHSHFNVNHNVSDANRYLSWILLFSSCSLFQRSKTDIFETLIHLSLILSVPFVLLSITHEIFFYIALLIHLFCWASIEKCAKNGNSIFSHFRVAYFFLTYIFLSFFGLGNISSINSFDPAWVRCFITAFSPLLMMSLILFKTLIPFLIVTCTLRTLIAVLHLQPKKLFVMILIYCNVMALNFLYLIKNTGSWLDIGISISHYVIQQVTILFLLLLFAIAKFLMASPHKSDETRINDSNDVLLKALPIYYRLPPKKPHMF